MGHNNSPLMHNGLAGINSSTEMENPQSYPANPDMEVEFKFLIIDKRYQEMLMKILMNN